MGACSAVGCSNSQKKGFALYCFPQGDKNRARRRVWEARTKRDKWKANDNSRLCEVSSSPANPPAKSILMAASDQEWQLQRVDSNPVSSPADSVLEGASHEEWQPQHVCSSPAGSPADSVLMVASDQDWPSNQKIADLQRKIKRLQKKNRDLVEENAGIKEGIKRVFSEDQMRALARKKNNGCPWSAETIKKALRLHFACGSTGYNMLISQDAVLEAGAV
ncbi:hypothetical protein HPB50_012300 [Hyalomma asiaticum]|uniref:Uncharacterized protein n=1 Tax=Hyalomma asiaticum TaxID=266040 RepID=A0ACB7RVS9_HYAAI|nr:hypothetical protein HPB50_012300 [Hyalomma asiaticum]